MFSAFFQKEVKTALSRPMIYIFMSIVGLLVFFAIVSDNVVIGGVVGDVKKNAPTVVTNYVTILNIFGLLFATAFFNNAALRDFKHGFNEILFSTPISKAGYFFGRFCGAWLLSTLVMIGVYIAFVLGAAMGPTFNWIGAERVGPTPWLAFINSYLLFVIPNMFLAGTVIFALATKFKNTIISFVGTLIIIIGYIVSLNIVGDLDNQGIAAMVDIFGITAYGQDIQYYTPLERNTISPAFTGYVLKNRLLWLFVGALILLVSYFTFSFSIKARKVKKKAVAAGPPPELVNRPLLKNLEMSNSAWGDFVSFFKINFLSIIKSNLFIILLLFSVIILISNLWGGFEYFGLKSYPVTYKMIDEINGISGLFVVIILVFFSGELVWRDRDYHINEVIDGTPHQSLISLAAKTLSLVLLASLLHVFLMFIGVLYQAFNGYTNFEFDVYYTDFLTGSFLLYLIWGSFLVFLQVIINNKYLAYFVSVLVIFIMDIILLILKVESNMLSMGSTSSTLYSDMNRFGPGMEGHLWFSAYWVLFGVLTLVLAGLFWPRGMNKSISDRLAVGQKSLGKAYYGTLGFCSVAWLAVAGFVYYNTQVLNPYDTRLQQEKKQVKYEQNFKQYELAPHPSITDVIYHIDIFPEERSATLKADLSLKNKTNRTIDSLHFTVNTDFNQEVIIPNSKLVFSSEEKDYLIYQLAAPILPGDSLQIKASAAYAAKGFENEVSNTSIIRNGTFFNNFSALPNFGYNKRLEIGDKNVRRKYDLPERQRMPDLQHQCSHVCMKNYLTEGTSDWVNVETYISTSEDQTAIAPGSLISKKSEGGRNHYHYKVDHPSQNFYSFISARYEIARKKWKGVDIEIYYHPAHKVNVNRMLEAVEKSLDYYTTHFGPYYHKQARIIEFPRYASFAQAFPGTMPYSEALGFIIDLEGEDKNNVIDAVIAHEMAHQYWAHQVIGAEMQGATMLSESFAEYSALMVMKQETDPIRMKDFLRYDLRRYLRGRSRESEKEQPLYKVENQGHIHYGKGAIILYALQDYIGEDQVNAALRGFLEEYRYREPPYPTAHDFMRHLDPQVPDSLQYLIKDWFEDITLYDLRMENATYTQNANDQYEVEVELMAKKIKVDSIGNVDEVPIADWIDIGFYKDRDEEQLFFKERVYLDQEQIQLQFTLDTLPAKAAIDPLRILIERIYDDNRKGVEEKE